MNTPPSLPRRVHDALVRSPKLTLCLCVLLVGSLVVIVSCTTPRVRTGPDVLMGDEPLIRVRVRRDAGDVRIAGGPRVVVRDTRTGSGDLLVTPVRVTVAGGSVTITDGRSERHGYPAFHDIEIAPEPGATNLSVDDAPMPGFVAVHPDRDDSSTFDVIAVMPIERYVPGVISRELYSSWAPEVYRVQAVCARGYAMHERARARRAERHYDVESTTRDQVFGGETRNPTAIRAAADTRGIVLAHAGEVLRAYYSSTCGDRPGSARDTWPISAGFEYNLAAPLQARERECACEASPLHRWTVERDTADLSARFRAWGARNGHDIRSVGRVRSIVVAERNRTGRPSRYRVSDDNAETYLLRAEDIRVACNTPSAGLPAITRPVRVNSGDFEAQVGRSETVFRGRGFGHGVGMCQFGTNGLVARGWEWREILGHYYPGARVARIYR